VTYVVLYLVKSFISSQLIFDLTTNSEMMLFLVPKAVTSLTNGAIACVVAVPLCAALRKGLDGSGLSEKMHI